MTTVTLPTVPPPPESRDDADRRWPRPGRYTVASGRSLTELTAWYGPLPTLRRRVALTGATLTVPHRSSGAGARTGPDSPAGTFSETVSESPSKAPSESPCDSSPDASSQASSDQASSNAGLPSFRFEFDGRYLTAALISERVDEARGRLQVTADLDVNGVAFPVLLRLRVVERADDRLLVVGRARLPYRLLRRATGFRLPWRRPATRLRLLVAAEFV
ncbi:hypothetical protein M2271_005897 [Streptomyces sp. LBL]|uniref:hypothetical protein n=1 Tax=Streptomyces sp. LBL TaxID=2940562 RepID=UPI00247622E9|nr:hypothetical protein [Streptomyces sp. LBL]MDH6628067.1 hypothetical protein [Streptomyces sp. LBL]